LIFKGLSRENFVFNYDICALTVNWKDKIEIKRS
jgi:hypothetical protein